MTDPTKIIEDAIKNRWTGSIELRLYFGEVRHCQVNNTIDLTKPCDISKFKQERLKPMEKVVGQ